MLLVLLVPFTSKVVLLFVGREHVGLHPLLVNVDVTVQLAFDLPVWDAEHQSPVCLLPVDDGTFFTVEDCFTRPLGSTRAVDMGIGIWHPPSLREVEMVPDLVEQGDDLMGNGARFDDFDDAGSGTVGFHVSSPIVRTLPVDELNLQSKTFAELQNSF